MTVDQQQRTGPPAPRRRSRRDEILEIAVGLFAARGYHGVSMDDIGSAAGVTGPALYHHFAGKEAMLVAALIPVSEGLLHGGRERVARHPDDARAALADLIDFHVEFALENPAVIALHLHELDRLPEEPRRQIRRLQRLYVEEWVSVLATLRPGLDAGRGAGARPRGVRPDELHAVPGRRGRPPAPRGPAAGRRRASRSKADRRPLTRLPAAAGS